jgi:1,4-dihydroxy-2-naphthoate octaprenyltransferase
VPVHIGRVQFQKIALSLRLHQLPAGVMPVLVGMAYARWKTGAFDFVPAVSILLLTALTQLGGMCLDDYFDHHSGVDAKVTNRTLFSGGSDLIQTGVLKAQTMLLLGIATLGLALLLAFGLTAVKGNWVLVGIYVFGIFSGIFYTAPPFSAAYRGWGEILIAANYGPTAVELGYAAQTGNFNISLLLVSLVFSGLILAANLVHEMLDYEADRAAGKKGWVVLLGLEKSKKLFSALLICPYVLLILSVTFKILPFAALLPLGTTAWGIGLVKGVEKAENHETLFAILVASFKIYVFFGLALTAGLILHSFM